MYHIKQLGVIMEKKTVKKIADQEIHKHEKHMHSGMKPTKLSKGGASGVSSESMKAEGRNMARANNQGGRK
jgi:hypothetical protein